MNSLNVIKLACADALDAMEEDPLWRLEYCSIVDPMTALEMAGIIETLLMHAEQTAPSLAAKVREQIGNV